MCELFVCAQVCTVILSSCLFCVHLSVTRSSESAPNPGTILKLKDQRKRTLANLLTSLEIRFQCHRRMLRFIIFPRKASGNQLFQVIRISHSLVKAQLIGSFTSEGELGLNFWLGLCLDARCVS